MNLEIDIDNLSDEQIYNSFPKILERYKKITMQSNSSTRIKELELEIINLIDLRNSLNNKITNLENSIRDLNEKFLTKSQSSKELEQEKLLLNNLNESMHTRSTELEKLSKDLERKVEEKSHKSSELEQQKVLLTEMVGSQTTSRRSAQRKYHLAMILGAIVLASAFSGFFYYENMRNEQREQILASAIKGKFLTKNLSGQEIETWAAWNMIEGETLYVTIDNSEMFDLHKIDVIRDAILSTNTMEISNEVLMKNPSELSSVYYKGWSGALEKAAESDTALYIPTKIEVTESNNADGDINIQLTNDFDTDGISGYTNSVVDQNQILLSTIKIYMINDLTDERLSTIVRHEFGHALGLGHSNDDQDLMAPVTKTKYPFISDCDINTISKLYNNQQSNEVLCEKK